jgi:integrase
MDDDILALKSQSDARGPVFLSPRTGVGLVEIKKGFRAALKDAQIEDFHFHDLRHTFGTRVAERGAGAFEIAELLGHLDLRMTKRYTHATSRSLRRAVQSLDNGDLKEFPTKSTTTEARKVS